MRKTAILVILGLALAASSGSAAEPLKMHPRRGEWAIHAIRATVQPDAAAHPVRAACNLDMHVDNPSSWLFPFADRPSPENKFLIDTASHLRVTYLYRPLPPGIAKARHLEGVVESGTWDVKRLGRDFYVAVDTETASRFGKWTRSQRLTLTARRLGAFKSDDDVKDIVLLDPELNSLWRC
jgi:hypothetical protein